MNNPKQDILIKTEQGLSVFKHFIPNLPATGTSRKVRAVFRDDGKDANTNVYYDKKLQQWLYHDFVTGETENAFGFVMRFRNCDFNSAIRIIEEEVLYNYHQKNTITSFKNNTMSNFSTVKSGNINYWYNFAPNNEMANTLKRYEVDSLTSYSFIKNKKRIETLAKDNDPIFSFKISDGCVKIYRPYAASQKHLWLGNKPQGYFDVYGIDKLPEFTPVIIIVEGLKDCIVANANGIVAVGVDNASTKIKPDIINSLQKKCEHLIVCYDNDPVGNKSSEKVSNEFGLRRIIIPENMLENHGKDISDFFEQKHTKAEFEKIVEEVLSIDIPLVGKSSDASPKTNIRLSKFEKVEQCIHEKFELRYNEVSNQIEYLEKDNPLSEFKPLNESNIYRYLQHNNISFSFANLTALLKSDFVSNHNPFECYFEGLPEWNQDNDIDYIAKLCNYIPAKEVERFNTHFKKALVRTIACAIKSKTINKQALILVQDTQNSGKTTFIRWLCPPCLENYIAENISTDKDSLIALSENFIINMDELATLSRAEINSLKSLFSKETIKARRPYDKNATSAPRRASFFGSTNKSEFLNDETGSVRWLCFELNGKINWNYKTDINIDDIWRQAYSLFKNGFAYELTPDEIKENEHINQAFQVNTVELELIQKHFEPGTDDDWFLTSSDIKGKLNEIYPLEKTNINNIGKALKILGFIRISKRTGSNFPVKGYYVKQIIIQN